MYEKRNIFSFVQSQCGECVFIILSTIYIAQNLVSIFFKKSLARCYAKRPN